MKPNYAIFVGGENCYANRDGGLKDGLPTYMYNSFIQQENTFNTEQQAIDEATRIGLPWFSVIPVYFRQ